MDMLLFLPYVALARFPTQMLQLVFGTEQLVPPAVMSIHQQLLPVITAYLVLQVTLVLAELLHLLLVLLVKL
jgi:hypothetical protein